VDEAKTSVTRLGKNVPFGLLFEGPGELVFEKSSKKIGHILGYFQLKHFLFIFARMSSNFYGTNCCCIIIS
jgi:hypothetical protein